jgi:SpoVK/Ycf46/Vps4 family AAA+-type ATPase
LYIIQNLNYFHKSLFIIVGRERKAKAKRKKDALADEPIEDLFNELLQAKIIRNYPITFLRDWIGDLSYRNYGLEESANLDHRLGEVKQLVLEYCVLPLISSETHRLAPLVRSVCIYGLPESGKTFLVNAISSEVILCYYDYMNIKR